LVAQKQNLRKSALQAILNFKDLTDDVLVCFAVLLLTEELVKLLDKTIRAVPDRNDLVGSMQVNNIGAGNAVQPIEVSN